MQTIQTKETPSALTNLLKAKGQSPRGQIQQPVGEFVDNKLSVQDTSAPEPEAPSESVVTPEAPNPVPEDTVGYEKRYWDLKAHHDKTIYDERNRNKQLEEQLATASKPKVNLPLTKEELDTFKQEQKAAYDIMRSVILEELDNDSVGYKQKIAEVTTLQKELKEKEAFKELLAIHPDALEIKASEKFKEWFFEQPQDIRNILEKSPDVKAVAKQLTLYKLEAGIKDKKKEETRSKVEDSLAVEVKSKSEPTPPKKIWTKTEIDAICKNYALYQKHGKEIDIARRENRVDMSK